MLKKDFININTPFVLGLVTSCLLIVFALTNMFCSILYNFLYSKWTTLSQQEFIVFSPIFLDNDNRLLFLKGLTLLPMGEFISAFTCYLLFISGAVGIFISFSSRNDKKGCLYLIIYQQLYPNINLLMFYAMAIIDKNTLIMPTMFKTYFVAYIISLPALIGGISGLYQHAVFEQQVKTKPKINLHNPFNMLNSSLIKNHTQDS